MFASEYVDAVVSNDDKVIRMCFRKVRFLSKRSADAEARMREFKTGKFIRSYLCPICGNYHLTSQPLQDGYYNDAA